MKSFYLFAAFISVLLLFACGPKTNKETEAVVEDTLEETTQTVFSDSLPKETEAVIVKDAPPKEAGLPIVKEKLPKGIKPCQTDSILVSHTRLEAVAMLGDSQIIKGKGFDNYLYRGTLNGVEYKKLINNRGFKVYVDTTQTVAIKDNELACKGYPVFLVNKTKKNLYLTLEDGDVMMIQEAKDENGNWRPIEEWWYSDCGSSINTPLTFRPGKLGMTRIRKYDGGYETELRVRVATGEGAFIYSHTFRGRISKEQLANDSAFAKKYPKLLYDSNQP
jgi:hypothetical protein